LIAVVLSSAEYRLTVLIVINKEVTGDKLQNAAVYLYYCLLLCITSGFTLYVIHKLDKRLLKIVLFFVCENMKVTPVAYD